MFMNQATLGFNLLDYFVVPIFYGQDLLEEEQEIGT